MCPEVPRDWHVESLGSVAEVLLSNVDKKSSPEEIPVQLCNYMDVYGNARITAGMPFMEATATAAQVEKFGLRVGDVLITKDSEDPSDIAVPSVVVDRFDRPVVCGYHLAILRPRTIDGPYLAWALRSAPVNTQFIRRANGTTRFGLTNGVIRSALIPVPPLAEQRKIAAILSSVDDAIAVTWKVIEQTKRVKQGLLQTLMTRGIGHTRFKRTEIGEIPKAWEVARLEEVASRGSGHTPSKRFPEYWDGDIKWVSLADSNALDQVYLSSTAKTITPEGIANSSAVVHPAGTVFVSRDASVGRSAIAACDLAVSQHFIAWRCGDRLNNHFLYYFLQQHKPEFERIAAGSTIKTIGLGYFKRLRIPLPPLIEQDQIAQALLAHDQAVSAQESTVEELTILKRGLMTDLFNGRVRVRPD